MGKAPEKCIYCKGDDPNCGFCEMGKPLDTQEDWDASWGKVFEALKDVRVQFWDCPARLNHPRKHDHVTVTWEGDVATCTDCGRTNKDVLAFPENRVYGCVDCGSTNHTTGDEGLCTANG